MKFAASSPTVPSQAALGQSATDPLAGGLLIEDGYTSGPVAARGAALEAASVEHFLQPLRPLLGDERAQEIVVNRPGFVLVETARGWLELARPELTMERLVALAGAVATYTKQVINPEHPILSATLGTDERIQIVIPPAVDAGTISVTLRKPSRSIWRLSDFSKQGLFRNTSISADSKKDVDESSLPLEEDERRLLQLLWGGEIANFVRDAVRTKRNIVVSGATGSGKTTFMKGIIQECSPCERLVTIEDAREIFLPNHPNKVHLLYSKNGQGLATVTATQLLVSCLRMKPDRILLAEIREGECYDFLRVAASGHPGSITSLHAGSCAEAFEQMGLMIRQSSSGSGLSHTETQRLLRLLVDVVVQYKRDDEGRRVSEIYYRPLRKRELARG